MTYPDYDRPTDARPGDGNPEGPLLRAVLFIFLAYVAIAVPLVALRVVWQAAPLAAVAVITLAAVYIARKVRNR